MSRHMKKLQLESVGLDAADSGSEEDDVSEEDLARRRFLQFSMSDSSEDEDEDEEPAAGAGAGAAGAPVVDPLPAGGTRGGAGNGAGAEGGQDGQDGQDDQDDLDDLDRAIAEAMAADRERLGDGGGDGPGGDAPSRGALCIRIGALNAQTEMRDRFGTNATADMDADREQQPQRRGRALPRNAMRRGGGGTLLNRRLLFGPIDEDLPKPPSMVGGGIGMRQLPSPRGGAASQEQFFSFEWSGAYRELEGKFATAAASHDPNELALFVGSGGYCHAGALMQLAMVCAHTAQPEAAAGLVRRALLVFEAAQLEAFRPCLCAGTARMDLETAENAPFAAALFRHAQLSAMGGANGAALEAAKLLLQLDAAGDPTCTWLVADAYALAARGRPGALSFLASVADDPPLLRASSSATAAAADAAPRTDLAEETAETGDDAEGGVVPSGLPVDVLDLPNVALSCALALWFLERRGDAAAALKSAFLKFPLALSPILEAVGADRRGRRAGSALPQDVGAAVGDVGGFVDWPSILVAPLFRDAASRWSGCRAAQKLLEMYCARVGKGAWREAFEHRGAETLLLAAAGAAANARSGAEARAMAMLGGGDADAPLARYAGCNPEDFGDSFSRLPGDMQLMNPQLLAPGVARAVLRQRREAARAAGADDAQLAAFLQDAERAGTFPGP